MYIYFTYIWLLATITIYSVKKYILARNNTNYFCQLAIVVRNVKCVINTLWTSIRCKRIWHDGSVSSKIIDSFILNCTLPSSVVHLHKPNFDSLRPRWEHSTSGKKRFSLVNSNLICLYCVIQLSDIPSISKQECHNCILGNIINNHSCVPLLAIHNTIQVWDSWCNDFNNFGILDSQCWSTNIYYMRLVPWNMERFLFFSIQRSLACCQAFPFSWCHVMVSFVLNQLKGLRSLEMPWLWNKFGFP